jgi:hypothetical protein
MNKKTVLDKVEDAIKDLQLRLDIRLDVYGDGEPDFKISELLLEYLRDHKVEIAFEIVYNQTKPELK